ncbi:hypothetical protein N8920_01525 [Opitutales bacterium]|nr:hypothetical protein [Opitutales bacterium]
MDCFLVTLFPLSLIGSSIIPYSGKTSKNGVNFHGEASFKFAIQGTNALSPKIFASDQTLYLYVRVDLVDKKGWREISPDQPIHSTPHSLVSDYAKIAGAVTPGSISSKML